MNLIGKTAEVRLRVNLPCTAEARLSPKDDFPAVVANQRVIELMELAATRLLRLKLAPGESTLSIEMNVTHMAPAVCGPTVRALATYLGGSGRLHRFSIHAFDESGLIASCEHTRAVVRPRRLLAQARRRAGLPSILLEA
jgi:fluoroacetyl-CoA thioesterase